MDKKEARKISTRSHLETALKAFSESDMKAFLAKGIKQSLGFHRYSFFNTFLIALQRPNYSYVAGAKKWLTFNRRIIKGVNPLSVLAPGIVENKKTGDDKLIFYPVNVFDLSQTEGAPLDIDAITGQDTIKAICGSENAEKLIKALMLFIPSFVGCKVELIDGGAGIGQARGAYYPLENKIVVTHVKDRQAAGVLSTLFHEIGHAMLKHGTDDAETDDARLKESQAQAFSYALASYFGLNNLEYSKMYIYQWIGDASKRDAFESIKAVLDVAVAFVTAMIEYAQGNKISIYTPPERPYIAPEGLNKGPDRPAPGYRTGKRAAAAASYAQERIEETVGQVSALIERGEVTAAEVLDDPETYIDFALLKNRMYVNAVRLQLRKKYDMNEGANAYL